MPENQMSLDEIFPEAFDAVPAASAPTQATKPAPVKRLPSKAYWEVALEVVNLWARYQSVKKLYINATHEETRHRVQPVVDNKKYYHGKVSKIRDQENSLSYQLSRKLADFANVCDCYNVAPVTREWLYDHLKEARDYASYRGKCQRRITKSEKYPARSLREL